MRARRTNKLYTQNKKTVGIRFIKCKVNIVCLIFFFKDEAESMLKEKEIIKINQGDLKSNQIELTEEKIKTIVLNIIDQIDRLSSRLIPLEREGVNRKMELKKLQLKDANGWKYEVQVLRSYLYQLIVYNVNNLEIWVKQYLKRQWLRFSRNNEKYPSTEEFQAYKIKRKFTLR